MSPGRLSGRVAVITGGTLGIGRAAVELFASEGASVGCLALKVEKDDPLFDNEQICFLQTDVGDPDSVRASIDAVVERWGRLNILYGNAGVNENGTLEETTIESWHRVLTTDLTGHFYLAKFGVPYLLQQGGGVVIFTASELALVGARRSVAYCSAKAGVLGLTRALAADLSQAGIRVNCLLPGPTLTPLMSEWMKESGDLASESQVKGTLLGRMAAPSEIAQAALFLASDESSFMTGAFQVVDGGVTSWDHV